MIHADFENADLQETQFQNSFAATDFKNANLRGANFQGAQLSWTDPVTTFDGAQIDGADFRSTVILPKPVIDASPLLKSFLAAKGWQTAKFDDNLHAMLLQCLSKQGVCAQSQ